MRRMIFGEFRDDDEEEGRGVRKLAAKSALTNLRKCSRRGASRLYEKNR